MLLVFLTYIARNVALLVNSLFMDTSAWFVLFKSVYSLGGESYRIWHPNPGCLEKNINFSPQGGGTALSMASLGYVLDHQKEGDGSAGRTTTRLSRIWAMNYLGRVLGTLLGRFIFDYLGFVGVFAASTVISVLGVLVIVFLLPEDKPIDFRK